VPLGAVATGGRSRYVAVAVESEPSRLISTDEGAFNGTWRWQRKKNLKNSQIRSAWATDRPAPMISRRFYPHGRRQLFGKMWR